MKATTLASFQDTESTLKRYVRQSSSLRPRSDTAQTPLSLEELLSPDIARGGAVSYRKSRASIFNDMSSEDLDRWMEKFGQAKLELRGMTDLYEEYGGDKAAEEILRENGEDPAAWKEIYKAYMEAPRTYLRGPSLTLSRNRSRSRTRRGSTASLTGRVDRMEFTDVTDIKDMSIILSGSTRG